MDFKKETVNSVVPFSNIREGELFEDGSRVYLKIEEIEDEEWGCFNAVDIQTGEVERFKDKDPVFKAIANITVRVFK